MAPRIKPSPLFDGAPLRLMRPQDLARELQFVMDGCGTTQYPNPMLDDDEWAEVINAILPADIAEIGTAAWRLRFPERQRAALGLQAARLCARLKALADQEWEMPPPEWVAAPFDQRERLLRLLGTGQLPVAWTRMTEFPD